jgi:hypothetical protein
MLLQNGEFLLSEFTPFACLQSLQLQRSHTNASQFFYWMTNSCQDLADLSIAIFAQLHVEQRSRSIALQNHKL